MKPKRPLGPKTNVSFIGCVGLIKRLRVRSLLGGMALAIALLAAMIFTVFYSFNQAQPQIGTDYSYRIRQINAAEYENVNYNLKSSFDNALPRVALADTRNQVKLEMELTGIESKSVKLDRRQLTDEKDQLVYENVLPDTDLSYEIIPDGVKENIVLRTPEAVSHVPEAGYLFRLDLQNLVPGENRDGSLMHELVSEDTGQTVVRFLPPLMIDANGVTSREVDLMIENDADQNGQYLARLTPDVSWLNDPARAFPIMIDPTVKGNAPVAEWNIDEAYSTTTYDNSGNSNDLTITGPTWTITDSRMTGNTRYLEFDGSNDYLTRATDTDFDFGTGSFSIAGWFRHVSAISGTDILLSYAGAVNGVGYKVYMNSSGNLCFGIDDTAGTFPEDSACSSTDYSDSSWHHFEAVKNGTTSILMYIDGQEVNSDAILGSVATLDASSTLYIGIDADGITNPWDGFLDQIVIYNYARTAAQVKADAIGTPQTAAAFGDQITDPLTDGLIGWWKLDETSGNASDSSGNATTLTDGSATTYAGAKFGNGVDLELDSTDYLYAEDNATLSLTGDLTISAWINPEDVTAFTGNIVGKWDDNNDSYLIQQVNDEIRMYIDSSANYTTTDAANLAVSTWYHVTGTYKASTQTVTLYINGEISASTVTGTIPSAIGDDAGRFHIGVEDSTAGGDAPSNYYDGFVDEVRIYNRAFSPREARDLYNWGAPPVGYWNMDENTGTAGNDISGNGFNLSFVNNAAWGLGKFGSGTVYDGTTDYLTYNDAGAIALDITSSYTAEAWVFFDEVSSAYQTVILKLGLGTGDANYWLGSSASADEMECGHRELEDSEWQIATTTTLNLTASRWYYAACVFDAAADTVTLYVDGVQYAQNVTAAQTPNTGDNDLFIGYDNPQGFGGTDLDGRIDEIKIFDYARTPAQIIQDMNAGHPLGGSPIGSSIGFWKFDIGYGDTAYDTIETGTNLDLAGACPGASACPNWTTNGKFGNALSFDGSDDYASIPTGSDTDLDFATTEPFTLTTWIHPTTLAGSGDFDGIVTKWDATSGLETRSYMLSLTNDDADTTGHLSAQVYDESANQALTVTSPTDGIAANTWYHLAMTFNGGTAGTANDLKLYLNGNLMDGNDANGSFAGIEDLGNDFVIGNWDPTDTITTNRGFTGQIDEVKVYSAALTRDQILIDMNRGQSAVLGSTSSQAAISPTYNTGAYPPATGSNNTGIGTLAWSNPGDITGSEDTKATRVLSGTAITNYLQAGNFGFTLPTDATINGILLSIERRRTGGTGNARDNSVRLVDDTNTVVGNNQASLTNWIGTDWTVYYGSSSDLWGETWTPAIINDPDFGAVMAATCDSGCTHTAEVDYMSLTVYYTIATTGQSNAQSRAFCPPGNTEGRCGSGDPSPIGWWKLDENTGTTSVSDSSANNQTATMNAFAAPTWLPGKIGSALDFVSASLNYLSIPTFRAPTGDFTYETWTNPDDNTDVSFFSAPDPNTGTDEIHLNLNFAGAVRLEINNVNVIVTTTTVPTGSWSHIAATRTGSAVTVYINGRVAGTATDSTALTFTTRCGLVIGVNSDNTACTSLVDYFDGRLDDIRVYDYGRTQSQVMWDYNRGAPVGWWKLDECTGATLYDSSENGNGDSNGNTGTWTGSGGTNTSAGTCSSGVGSEAWNNGTTGKRNASLDFDSSDDVVTVTNADEIDFDAGLQNGVSLSAWVYANSDGEADVGEIFDKGAYTYCRTDTQGTTDLDLECSLDLVTIGDGLNDATLNITDGLTTNTWHHVVMTYTDDADDEITIYIDGQNRGSSTNGSGAPATSDTNNLLIGGSTGANFDGQIDDVRVFNYELSPQQISTLFANGAVNFE